MEELKAHPNTQAVLAAWRRLSDNGPDLAGADEAYPELIRSLFVLGELGDDDFPFRRVGPSVEKLFGRILTDHNFLTLWNEPDRLIVAASLNASRMDNGPVIVTARGETLDGRRIELEFMLAPLAGEGRVNRVLGLCQALGSTDNLGARPLRRLQVLAVYPPAPLPEAPAIRVVSSR